MAESFAFDSAAEAAPAAAIAALLDRPDEALDIARAKLRIDSLIVPDGDAEATMAQIDRLADAARALAGPSPTEVGLYAALRRTLYEPGEWNDGRAFSYDHADPEGQDVGNKLIATYLDKRLGNCVSMPVLFLIIAQRLNLDAALALAPLHLFVRLRLGGQTLNAETTSGGHPARDEWYRKNFAIGAAAIASGTYLRALTAREAIAHLATTLAEHLGATGRHRGAVHVCAVILRHYPCDVYALIKLGTACARVAQAEFLDRYGSVFQLPPPLRGSYLALLKRNRECFLRAEALGWTPGA
jgi:regulator of sirC expression with transglutaminase-like and TPR domain